MSIHAVPSWLVGNGPGEAFQGWRQTGLQHPLCGSTFEGLPFFVELSHNSAFDRGGAAVIHRGRCWGPWRKALLVAVKVSGPMLRPVERELFVREVRTVSQASLRHPLILPFIGTVCIGDQTSLVSLYMPNGNLLEYVKSHKGCDKKKLVVQVAEALNYLHNDVGLVHGDLKCANVLISGTEDALLADFGLSTSVEKSQSAVTTLTGIREMNTARFAAPELLLGTDDPASRPRSKTRESDVYAFSMLILEHTPWAAESSLGVIRKVCNGQRPPRPTADGFVSISHPWWEICQRSRSFDPGDRPPIDAVLNALRETEVDPYHKLTGHGSNLTSVAYLGSPDKVVSGSSDGSILIWDTQSGRAVMGNLEHGHCVLCVVVSPDGHHICSGGSEATICRWDGETGALIDELIQRHTGDVHAIAYSPDGMRIVSGGGDRAVRVWDTLTGDTLGAALIGHAQAVLCVAFSLDGQRIASGSRDHTVRVWDTATGETVATLQHQGAVGSVHFSPNGIDLVSGSADTTVRIWDVATGIRKTKIRAHSTCIRTTAISPSGRYIASGSRGSTIRIWDARTGDAVGAPLTGHENSVRSIAFSPDGRSIVSASKDGTVRIWDLFD